MKKNITLITCFVALSFYLIASFRPLSIVDAAVSCPTGYTCQNGCTSVGQCGQGNKLCIEIARGVLAAAGGDCGSALLGSIEPPAGVSNFNWQAGSQRSIGLFYFISAGLRLFFIISGILIFSNFIISAWTYITQAGDVKAHTEVKDRLTYSVIGLAVIVAAFIFVSLIGAVVFGDPGFILKPDISQYGATVR